MPRPGLEGVPGDARPAADDATAASLPMAQPDTGLGQVIGAVRELLRWEAANAQRRRASSPEIALPDPVVDPLRFASAQQCLTLLARHRLVTSIGPYARALGFTPEIDRALVGLDRQLRMASLEQLGDTMALGRVLRSAAIPFLMLKGVSLALQTTGDPGSRGPGDIDVLVPQAQVDAVSQVLLGGGLTRVDSFCPPVDSPLFAPTTRVLQEMVYRLNGREVDVHWRLDIAANCLRWDFAELFDRCEHLSVGRHSLPTLDRQSAAIFNASHGIKDAWFILRELVDQARLQRGLDLDAAAEEARRVGAATRWAIAQAMLAKLSGQPDPSPRSRRAQLFADAMWDWLQAGRGPSLRADPQATVRTVRMLAVERLTHDSARALGQRLTTLVLPVKEMAADSLGRPGREHPWLYPLATPYLLPKRFIIKSGLGRSAGRDGQQGPSASR